LESRGVKIVKVTLHVGLGTFLPIKSDNLEEHEMHREWGQIQPSVMSTISEARATGQRVWALGTTATRVLEAWKAGHLKQQADGSVAGETNLFIKPGFEFQVVDVLMTNFHQPESTLLALVAAFAGRENVFAAYHWAIEKRFRLFSYGDLSIWMK
jgi:S-adenosylmethionine:tRNA ribosyltransferase-isomerase